MSFKKKEKKKDEGQKEVSDHSAWHLRWPELKGSVLLTITILPSPSSSSSRKSLSLQDQSLMLWAFSFSLLITDRETEAQSGEGLAQGHAANWWQSRKQFSGPLIPRGSPIPSPSLPLQLRPSSGERRVGPWHPVPPRQSRGEKWRRCWEKQAQKPGMFSALALCLLLCDGKRAPKSVL